MSELADRLDDVGLLGLENALHRTRRWAKERKEAAAHIRALESQLKYTREGSAAVIESRDMLERCWKEQGKRADKAEAKLEEARETLRWIATILDTNITPNNGHGNRLLLGGKYHTGVVVDWVHSVFTGLRDISEKSLAKIMEDSA